MRAGVRPNNQQYILKSTQNTCKVVCDMLIFMQNTKSMQCGKRHIVTCTRIDKPTYENILFFITLLRFSYRGNTSSKFFRIFLRLLMKVLADKIAS